MAHDGRYALQCWAQLKIETNQNLPRIWEDAWEYTMGGEKPHPKRRGIEWKGEMHD